jgi:dTDP-4-dehydrorhamnose reductase
MAQRTVLVTGAGGLIGSHLVKCAPAFAPDCNVVGLTRHHLDLTSSQAVRRTLEWYRPSLIIHCAALSKSTDCQENPELAKKINVDVTARLAELAGDTALVFLSTDLVFDGRQGNYGETARVNPLSVYAETKTAAEEIILGYNHHIVIRTSLNGGISPTGNRSFNEEIRLAWQQGRTLTLFADEFRCPIPVVATAQAIWELASANRPGLYHVAGCERLSRYQIGQLLAARWPQLNPKFQRGLLKDYQGAPRAPDTSLNSAKAQKLLSFHLPGLQTWLKAHPNEPF